MLRPYINMIKYKICFIIILSSLLTSNIPAYAPQPLLKQKDLNHSPIRVGEVLTYSAKIKHIPAGTQTLKITRLTTLNGKDVYHLKAKSQTEGLFSWIYKFEDSSESYVTKSDFHPIRFAKNIKDRSYRANVRVDFDSDSGKIRYSQNNKVRELTDAPVGIQDELSILYLIRVKKLKVGNTYTFPALIGKRIYDDLQIEVFRREKLKTAIGKLDTIVLRSSHDYTIWLTNDNRKIPVKIEAETKIGKLVGVLKKVEYIQE